MFKWTAKHLDPSIALLVKGVHGIGKSQIVAQVAEELGMELVVFFCSQIGDVGDFIGLPKHKDYINRFYKVNRETREEIELSADEYMQTKGDETWFMKTTMTATNHPDTADIGKGEITTMTRFCPPYWYKKGVDIALFLDEINRPRQEIQNAVMQLTLEKKVLDLQLTKGSRIFGAINPSNIAAYGLEEMAAAQLDRWMVVELKTELNEFIEIAEKRHYHESIINYVEQYPRNLIPYDNEELTALSSKGSENKVPSPRSYEMLSKAIYSLGINDGEIFKAQNGDKYLSEIVRGCVGPGVAMTFTEVYYSQSVKIEDAIYKTNDVIKIIKGYHAGRQKRLMNNINKWIDEHFKNADLKFVMEGGKSIISTENEEFFNDLKTIQKNYLFLINNLDFDVKASIFNKNFVDGVHNSETWTRCLISQKVRFKGTICEMPDGATIRTAYNKNAVNVV